MVGGSGFIIDSATLADAEEILTLQRLAFAQEARLYNDDTIAPLTETLADLKHAFAAGKVFKAVADDRIVGAVRGLLEDRTCHIERLMVHPNFQRRGLGERLMRTVEAAFPEAEHFALSTGHLSETNLRRYERLGYREDAREKVHEGLTLVHFSKPNTERA